MFEILVVLSLCVHFLMLLILIGIGQSIARDVLGIARRQQSDQIRKLYNTSFNYMDKDKIV